MPKGYGMIHVGGSSRTVHRVAAALWLGFDLDSDLCVLHRCDNPPCFNPSHLFVGTNADNARDRWQKGRYAKGAESTSAKLTAHQVEDIRVMSDAGMPRAELGRRFGVHPSTIRRIATGERYAPDERTPMAIDKILALYKPNVGSGNFMPDVANRGRNKALVDVAVALGFATRDEMEEKFREIDQAAWNRTQAHIDRLNSERSSALR